MKYAEIIRFACLLTAWTGLVHVAAAQEECKALPDSIATHYEGDCRKGLANGEGKASGKDAYTGSFRKGLPHGAGTYTWANGNTYEGDFKNGLMDGKGKMVVVKPDGSRQTKTGYWSKGDYLGEHEHPYEILSRSPEVLSVTVNPVQNPAGEGNALFVQILHKGRVQQSPNFTLSETTGILMSRIVAGLKTKFVVGQFPFGFSLGYMGERVEMIVYQAGSWDIRVDFNK